MHGKELGSKLADFILGKKVEGTVAAVLPPRIELSQRYIVTTTKGLVNVHVPNFINYGIIFPIYSHRQQLRRGEEFNGRSTNIKPWIDGQTVHF